MILILAIEANALKKLQEASHSEDRYLVTKLLYFEQNGPSKDKVARHLVYIEDLTDYICHIHRQRDIHESDTILKLGIDTGGSVIKGTLIYFSSNIAQ